MFSATHLHAMMVHFPIALIIVAFVSEITAFFYNPDFFRKMAFYLLMLGAIGTIASFLVGRAAGAGMDEGSLGKAMELHEQTATLALWLTLVTAILYLALYFIQQKARLIRLLSLLLFAVVVGAIARTGYLGGQLVFKHGAGIELEISE